MKNSPFSLWAGPVNRAGESVFPPGIAYALPADCPLTDKHALLSAWRGSIEFFYYHVSRASSIRIYDDGYGPAWIHRDSMGISGIARASTFEDAYGICEDEFFPEAGETVEELEKEYGPEWSEDNCFDEGYGFRPNGPNASDTLNHGIYSKDLNGDALDELTRKERARLEITLIVEGTDEPWPAFPRWSDALAGEYQVS